jgi:hypothetical protein
MINLVNRGVTKSTNNTAIEANEKARKIRFLMILDQTNPLVIFKKPLTFL